MHAGILARLAIPLILFTAPAAASVVVFDHYPIDGQTDRFLMSGAAAVSNSFNLSANTTVVGINFSAWVDTGAHITAIDWAIGTLQYDDSLGSGTGTVTGIQFMTSGSNDIYANSLSLPDIQLNAGTYYLTLLNAVSTSGPVYWDMNSGTGVDAYAGALHLSDPVICETILGHTGACAESFQILGLSVVVPEPASWTLILAGIAAAAVWRGKRNTVNR